MRRSAIVFACLALLALGGCASVLGASYDEAARNQCDRETTPQERGACYDRIDQNRRTRDAQ